ncbi:glycoside hydrolase family 95-like protein [Rhizobium sp. BT-226]|uniref:glycoside hydrolase family 95-like protein n=1 Tax=Rhizobium sp. BT-226 TaxID=2986922 RepID=UPI0035590FC5
MLAHTRSGEIRLLPALPQALSTGRVSGLRLRRGIELDMEWSEGTLQTARLKSTREQTVLLRSKAGEQTVALRAGDWTTASAYHSSSGAACPEIEVADVDKMCLQHDGLTHSVRPDLGGCGVACQGR